ncbi:uncharacterized protein LOC106179171 [Lingula anatina]|uniref:Uncharacterized protein LOC106179171 n=1 Tax=Lingula anatina TaxID=7574 RepID=A0A1S3K6M8_LINAN|nr:uncharacterized protein LOC106179171 [Lingula anatina]|eukprot:XP_013418157.1 uncharacterized protein LOC106179171 [Lingula anatina]
MTSQRATGTKRKADEDEVNALSTSQGVRPKRRRNGSNNGTGRIPHNNGGQLHLDESDRNVGENAPSFLYRYQPGHTPPPVQVQDGLSDEENVLNIEDGLRLREVVDESEAERQGQNPGNGEDTRERALLENGNNNEDVERRLEEDVYYDIQSKRARHD